MYGFWTLAATFIGYYSLLDMGLSSALDRHIARAIGAEDNEELNRVFNTALLIFSCLGVAALLISIFLAGLAPYITSNQSDATLFLKVILVLGINMAIGIPLRAYSGVLNAQLHFNLLSAIQFISLILRTLLIVLALHLGYKVLGLAVVTFLSTIPGSILYIYFANKNLPFLKIKREYWDRGTMKTLFSYTSILSIALLADQLRFHVDVFVVGAFINLAAVTHYRIAGLMAQYFLSLISACMGVLTPLFSQQDGAGDHEKIRKTLFIGTKISIAVSSFVGFGLIAWGKPFIERWMGQEYLDAYPVLFFLVLGTVFAMWQFPSVSLMYGTSKHKFFAYFNTLEGVINVLLSLMLVQYYGLLGVALGTFIPMTVIKLVVQPIYFCHVSSIKYSEYIYRMSRSIAVVCLSLAVPTLISLRYAAPDYRTLFTVAFMSSCIYALTMWFIEFSPNEKNMLRRAILSR